MTPRMQIANWVVKCYFCSAKVWQIGDLPLCDSKYQKFAFVLSHDWEPLQSLQTLHKVGTFFCPWKRPRNLVKCHFKLNGMLCWGVVHEAGNETIPTYLTRQNSFVEIWIFAFKLKNSIFVPTLRLWNKILYCLLIVFFPLWKQIKE